MTRQKGDIAALITPYNPPRMFRPVKRKASTIDLTSSYLEDYSAFRKLSDDKARAEQNMLDVLDSQIQLPEPRTPTPYRQTHYTPKQALLLLRNIIIKETLALRP